MGNDHNDNYLTQRPINAASSLKQKNIYYWVDSTILRTQQNKAYITILKEIVQIYPFQTWKAFIFELDSLDIIPNKTKIILITSLSLPQQAYTIFQYQNKINSIILYGNYQQDRGQIIANYPKIRYSCQSFQQLISQIKQIEVSQKQNIHFYCEQQMVRLNRWMFNWLVLQQFGREKGKKDFIELVKATSQNSNDIKRYQKLYDVNKVQLERDQMVLQWMGHKNFYINTPMQMLSTCKDTFRLSLVRQPLFDIYNAIRANYALSSYQQTIVYTLISLSLHQINRFKQANFKYIYFSTFLICSFDQGRKRLYSNEFRLTIKLRGKANNTVGGYIVSPSEVLININNPFEVLQADLEKGQILLGEVTKNERQTSKSLNQLQVHRQFVKYLVRIIPGQILSSFFNEQLSTYKQLTKKQLTILINNDKQDYYTRRLANKLQMAKIRLYFHLQSEKIIQKQLLQVKQITLKLQNSKDTSIFKTKIYFMLVQLYFRMSDFTKFGKCIGRLKCFQKENGAFFSLQQRFKLKVYSIYSYITTNKTHIEQNIDLIREIQAEANNKLREDIQVSELYFIITLTKIKCEELLNNHKKAISLFDQLIESVLICQGRNLVYEYFDGLKKQLLRRIFKSKDDQEQKQKAQRVTSLVPLAQLLAQDCFPLSLKGIDLTLYSLHDK